MKTQNYRYAILWLLFLLSAPGGGSAPIHAAEHYHFTTIALKAGLPSTLSCIYSDSRGYIWTGTRAGLGRFDGHEQYRYTYEQDNPHSLPGDNIYQIAEDAGHTLWVMTDQGVASYDYRHNHFHRLTDTEGEAVTAFAACRYRGGMLFATGSALYRLDEGEQQAVRWHDLQSGREELHVVRLCLLPGDRLLVGSRWQGVCLIDLATGRRTTAPYDCGREVTDMMLDSRQRLWIATYNEGVRCFDPEGRLLQAYHTGNSALSHNIVLCMTEREGNIWMGTDGGGINILNPETATFAHLTHLEGDKKYSLPTNSINSLYNDPYGNLWIGGVYNGLIGMNQVFMKTYADAYPGSHRGLSHPVVLSLYQQPDDEALYIGTDGGGLNRLNPADETFDSYPSTQGMKVASICGFGPRRLLLSCFSQGVFAFDLQTGALSPFTIIDAETTARLCLHGHAVNLYQDTPHTVLLLSDHVYIYHLDTRRFTLAQEERNTPISPGSLQAIAATPEATYLYDMRRIYRLSHRSERLKAILTCHNDQTITSATRDAQGRFWLGTNRGLVCFDPMRGSMTPHPTALFSGISSIACDPQGRLWIGADNSLFTYLPHEERFVMYGESDGVMPNEYRSKSCWTTRNGDIYMGGVQGLLHIGADWESVKPDIPVLQLSDIRQNGESSGEMPQENGQHLSVPMGTHVSLHFMAREGDIFRQRLYRYLIPELDDAPVVTRQPNVALRAVQRGSYRLLVACNTKEGEWTPYTLMLTLHVLPPWYASWWFVLACSLTGTLLIILFFVRLERRRRRRMQWMMKEHERQVYEEKVRFLINVSHELRTPLTLIYAPLKRLLQQMSDDSPHYLSLKAIYRQSQRMKDLINMVLDVRKMEVGEGKLLIRPHRLNEWIGQVSQDFVGEAEARGIRFELRLDERVGEVSFDREKLEIVLTNLLMNALKHSPQGSRITVSSEPMADGRWVRIAVSDQGKGLQQVDARRLFTRFYQGGGEQQGTGIGLSYAKILVEQHKGFIGAVSNADQGATFYFEIPLKQATEELLCAPKPYLNELIADDSSTEHSTEEAYDTTPYTLLIADDNSDLTAFLQESLAPHFKRIIVAADGLQALQLTRSHHPDILISDVMMPRMNGYQLCQELKKDIETSHIPIILLTAKDDSQSMVSGYQTGADDYLTKPFELDTLLAVVGNRLRNRDRVRRRYLSAGPLPQPEDNTFSQADETFLLKLNEVIQKHLAESGLDVALLCKEMAMSRASLYNKIKALTGISANEYINKLRMEKAISLIRTTSLPFTEIAEQVGFSTSSYFSTAFKQYTGCTPTQYKKELKR